MGLDITVLPVFFCEVIPRNANASEGEKNGFLSVISELKSNVPHFS